MRLNTCCQMSRRNELGGKKQRDHSKHMFTEVCVFFEIDCGTYLIYSGVLRVFHFDCKGANEK